MSARCAWLHSVPDPRWDERPLACVVPRPGARPSADTLKAFLAERVARWWVPERWSFIDQVPKTSVGEFDKKLLRARYAEGAPHGRGGAGGPDRRVSFTTGPDPGYTRDHRKESRCRPRS